MTSNSNNNNSVIYLHDVSEDEEVDIKDNLKSIIDDAKGLGCKEALKKNNHNLEYILSPKRSAYLSLANIQKSDDVLEIGSSMGQHSIIIAQQCNSLATIEVVPQQAEFARVWCDECELTNVEISAGGSSGKLPYASNSFDLVVCNYVLEWCAGRSQMDPESFHRQYIQEMFRVLKPNGRLLLATKNRFSIRYILGSEDEHLGIRFGSALPRVIQNRFRKRANLGHPTGYLHSWNALQKILEDTGFNSVIRYLAYPDNRYADFVGPFDEFSRDTLSESELSRIGIKNRVALHLSKGLFEKTSNSLVFLAIK